MYWIERKRLVYFCTIPRLFRLQWEMFPISAVQVISYKPCKTMLSLGYLDSLRIARRFGVVQGKKSCSSVFYWVIQKQILRVQLLILIASLMCIFHIGIHHNRSRSNTMVIETTFHDLSWFHLMIDRNVVKNGSHDGWVFSGKRLM